MTLTVRPPRPDDLGAVVELGRAFDLAFLDATDWSAEELAREWDGMDDLERDAWIVEDAGGPVVGYATVELRGDGRVRADGYVHPARFGRGIGALLVEHAERRAREMDGAAGVVENAVLAADAGAAALLEGRGYRAVRHFLRMQIDLPAVLPEPEPVAGVTIDTFRPGEDDAAVHALVEQEFDDGWSRAAMAEPRFDASLWFVARSSGGLAGIALCTWKRFDIGFVNRLAVVPLERRRGLGSALLLTAFAKLAARGETRVQLGVDAHNPTAARRLYERAGMRPVWQADVYERPL